MKKFSSKFKYIVLVALTLCLCFAMFVACNKDGGGTGNVTYTLSVNDGYINGDTSLTSAVLNKGASVSVKAVDKQNKVFVKWTSSDSALNGSTSNPVTFTLNGNVSLSAEYADVSSECTLTVLGGGYVIIDEQHIASHVYSAGSSVTVYADETDASGDVFSGWTIDNQTVSTGLMYTFTITQDTRIVANYAPVRLTAQLELASEIDSVRVFINDTALKTMIFDSGATAKASVDMSTVPEDKEFAGWKKGAEIVSELSEYSFQINDDTSLLAAFRDKEIVPDVPEYSLRVINGTITGAMYGTEQVNDFNGKTAGVFKEGTVVSVKADNDSEDGALRFSNWTINGNLVGSERTYIHEISADVAITASFDVKYVLRVKDGSKPEAVTLYSPGELVTLTADVPSGKYFAGWFIDGNQPIALNESYNSTSATYKFNIERDLNISAHYAAAQAQSSGKYTVYVIGGTAYSDKGCTQVLGDGKNLEIPPSVETGYCKADGIAGWDFKGWYAKFLNSGTDYTPYNEVIEGKAIMVTNQTHGNLCLVAVYERNFTVKATGGTVYKAGEEEPATGTTFAQYQQLTIIANTVPGKQFSHWALDGNVYSENATLNITVTGSLNLTAVFKNIYDVSVSGGVFKGTTKTNDKVVDGGYSTVVPDREDSENEWFRGWQRDGKIVSTQREYKFNVKSNISVTALYGYKYKVTVTDGTVDGVGSGWFEEGTSHNIVANEIRNKKFKHWIIDGIIVQSSSPNGAYTITVNANMTVSAAFDTVWTIKSTDEYCAIGDGSSKTQIIYDGDYVEIKVAEVAGYYFSGWKFVTGAGGEYVYDVKKADGTFNTGVSFANDVYTYRLKPDSDLSVSARLDKAYTVTWVNEGNNKTSTVKVKQYASCTSPAAPDVEKKQFLGWYDNNGDLRTTNRTYKIESVAANVTYYAKYEAVYEIKAINGVISSAEYNGKPVNDYNGLSSGLFRKNTKVNFELSLPENYRFDNKWTSSKGTLTGSAAAICVTVADSDETYTAQIVRQYKVVVTNKQDGGELVDAGTTNVKVNVTVPDDMRFDKWKDAEGNEYEGVKVNDNTYSYTIAKVDKDWTLTAQFIRLRKFSIQNLNGVGFGNDTLEYVDDGSNKTVTFDCTTPNSNMSFMGWKVNDVDQHDLSKTITVRNITRDTVVEPIFSMLYSQTTVVDKTDSFTSIDSYGSYASKVTSTEGFTIPGLSAGENFVLQGIDYDEINNWMLLSGYINPNNTFASVNSMIFVMDMNGVDINATNDAGNIHHGKLIKEILLKDVSGNDYTEHCGGICVSKDNVFVSFGQELLRIPLANIVAAKQTAWLSFVDTIKVPSNASFCTFADDILWVGDFYRSTTSYPIANPDHLSLDGSCAWVVGYDLRSGSVQGFDSETGFRSSALATSKTTYATPDYILRTVTQVQGMTVAGNKIVLSTSYGRQNSSYIYLFDNVVYGDKATAANGTYSLNGTSVRYWNINEEKKATKVEAPPMTEDIALFVQKNNSYVDEYFIYVATESASNLYLNGIDTGVKSVKPVGFAVRYKVTQ